jgi:hypothetical protein
MMRFTMQHLRPMGVPIMLRSARDVFFLAIVSSAAWARADVGDVTKEPDKRLAIFGETPPQSLRGGDPRDKGLFARGLKVADDGKLRAWGVSVGPVTTSGRIREGGVYYPPLAEGDIVPLLGGLYRVSSMRPKVIEFLKLEPGEDRENRFALRSDSFTIPMSRFGEGRARLLDVQWILDQIVDPKKPPSQDYVDVTVTCLKTNDRVIRAELEVHQVNGPGPQQATVKEGDVLVLFGKSGHRIRRIVPPLYASGVIGWIELDWSPIAGRSLEAEKQVVRPMKKDE